MDLCSEYDGILLDYSRQLATPDTMAKLFSLAEVNFWKFSSINGV